MKLYHRTSSEIASIILKDGFRDGSGHYGTDQVFTGVWLSGDAPLDENEGAEGDTVLMVVIPESVIADYEWIEEGKGYREFLIPADLVNQYGSPVIAKEDEWG